MAIGFHRFYDPVYFVDIQGKQFEDLGLASAIVSFSYSDSLRGANQLRLTLDDPKLVFVDLQELLCDAEVVCSWGYLSGPMGYPRKMRVSRIEPNFPENSGPRLVLTCLSDGVKANKSEVQKNWGKEKSTAEIAREIAAARGWRSKVTESDDGFLEVDRMQKTTDIQFLVALGKKIDFLAYVVGGRGGENPEEPTLVYGPRDFKAAPSFSFQYYTDRDGMLLSFRPQVRTGGRKQRQQAANIDDSTGSPFTAETTPDTDTNGTRDRLESSVDPGPDEWRSEKEPQNHVSDRFRQTPEANAEMSERNMDASGARQDNQLVSGDAIVLGNPNLGPGLTIELLGLGEKFSGKYFVEGADHAIGTNGYRTKLKLSRNSAPVAVTEGAQNG